MAAVSAQHTARRLFAELDKEQSFTRQMNVEWAQLQLESSTWAMHSRIEKIAVAQLGMTRPTARHVRVMGPQPGVATGR